MPESKTLSASKGSLFLALWSLIKRPQMWLALFSSLFLAALFYLHDYRIEDVKIGNVCTRFIVAQTDFDHVDHKATRLLQNQARYQMGSIFKFDERTLLMQVSNLKKNYPQISETTLKNIDHFIESLIKARFSDPKTLKRLGEMNWQGPEAFYLYSHQAGGLPEGFWGYQLMNIFDPTLRHLASKLENIPFILIPDVDLESKTQQLALDQIDPIKTTYHAGQILLGPGDKVQSYHKDLMISMKKAQNSIYSQFSLYKASASFVMGILFTFLYGVYLRKSHPNIAFDFSKLLLLTLLIILGIGGAKCIEFLMIKSGQSVLDGLRYSPILALSVLMITLLIDRNVALLSFLLMLVMSYLFLAFEPERFMLINLMAAAFIMLLSARINRRRQIFTGMIQTYLMILPAIIAFHIYDKNLISKTFIYDLAINLSFIIVSCLLILMLLPFIERIFKVTTNMVLTEYLDPNHELLRRLTLEAPGTYQHSLLVGHIAEYAARAIGANDLFCRVAALYHDIGKIYNPQYFTENQLGGFNIHRLLTPKESASVIIAHVEEGEKLAKKYNLPDSFIDIMKEHHGTTLAYYFYKKELEKFDGNKEEVSIEDFRYKGPKPKSKESAIIMLADCIEAASRSLENSSEETITALVEKIIKERLYDGQLEDSCLTFEELKKVKKAMVKALMVTHHVRVRYPLNDLIAEATI